MGIVVRGTSHHIKRNGCFEIIPGNGAACRNIHHPYPGNDYPPAKSRTKTIRSVTLAGKDGRPAFLLESNLQVLSGLAAYFFNRFFHLRLQQFFYQNDGQQCAIHPIIFRSLDGILCHCDGHDVPVHKTECVVGFIFNNSTFTVLFFLKNPSCSTDIIVFQFLV